MNKFLTIATLVAIIAPGNAIAGLNCCGNACKELVGTPVTYDSSCTNDSICKCQRTITGPVNGVLTVTPAGTFSTRCDTATNTAYASCIRGIASYECASGYYGSPTIRNKVCNLCPDNATCPGGELFSCNAGFYMDGSGCKQCPSPDIGATSVAGATSITQCYIPSGTAFSDSTGSGIYTANCNYSN